MDQPDEQDMENTGGGPLANGANGTNGTNGANGANGQHPTPEGSLYQEENDDSDMDDEAQDDEDLLSQPLPMNQQSLDAAGASSLTQLSNFMNMHHPQLLAKFRGLEHNEAELLQGRNSLEVLQAAMTSGTFNNLLPPAVYVTTPPPPPPPPPHSLQNNHPQVAGNLGNQVAESQALACSASSSRASASASQPNSPPRCRNNGESSQGNVRNNGDAREGEARAASANSQHPPGTTWSFEEQFRQLYELDDNPERKIFLDDLFTFMQSRGTPISRLPIMAKSVLDLFELYKLVVLRGGLVEVINKKLWQEIIKGLRLPASITSAAFTLRTQYMKYLYPYEREKEALSTQEQLQTAIETNRRESRRNNYGYNTNNDSLVPRNQHNSMPPTSLPMLSIAQITAASESQHHVVNGHPQAQQHLPQHLPNPMAQVSSHVSEYMMRILRERNTIPNNPMLHQGSTSTPPPTTSEGFKSGLHFWNIYSQGNSNIYSGMPQAFSPSSSHSPLAPANSPEPQREALDLANSAHRSDPVSSPTASRSISSPPSGEKRNPEAAELSSPVSNKKMMVTDEEGLNNTMCSLRIKQMVSTRENGERGLEVSIDIDGTLYEGVLPAKHNDSSSTSSSPNSKRKRSQNSDS